MKGAPAPIIVKRKKVIQGGGGGGSWKVAFADFMVAMMAFFLVLWLLSVSDEQDRRELASAMRDVSILDGKISPFEHNGSVIPSDIQTFPSFVETPKANDNQNREEQKSKSDQDTSQRPGQVTSDPGPFKSHPSLNILKDVMSQAVAKMEASENVTVEAVPQGLRIRLQDSEDEEMFNAGGATMNPFFEDLLLEMAPMLLRVQNGLILSGHTDATPFGGSSLGYSNWELSGDRAMMARKVLQAGGVPRANIAQVTGMADTALALPLAPRDPANRRIEILILTPEAEQDLMQMFGQDNKQEISGSDPVASGKRRGARTLNDTMMMKQLRQSSADNRPVTR